MFHSAEKGFSLTHEPDLDNANAEVFALQKPAFFRGRSEIRVHRERLHSKSTSFVYFHTFSLGIYLKGGGFFMEKIPASGEYGAKEVLCRFSLAVMSDLYVEQILGAIGKTNTQGVKSQTDALSTTYRGHRVAVLQALQDFFCFANDGCTHMTLEAQFTGENMQEARSIGPISPSGFGKTTPFDKDFFVLCKCAFYPLGVSDHKVHIKHMHSLAQKEGLAMETTYDTTKLAGKLGDVFAFLNTCIAYAQSCLEHYALHVSFSVNSPTKSSPIGEKEE